MPRPKKQIRRRERLADLYNRLQTNLQWQDQAQRVREPTAAHGQEQLNLFRIATNGLASPQPSEAPVAGALPVYRIQLVEVARIKAPSVQLRSSFDAASLFQVSLHDVDREHFVVLLLNRKNRCIGMNTVSIGSLTSSVVHPREVFKAAILANAAALICGHNHPSGDTEPSREDRALTKRLVECGKMMGIDVLDHVIVGHGHTNYYSFADQNRLHFDA
jgi:DNA repair protein RadC